MKRIFAHHIQDIPNTPFFAILLPKSVTIPGDERSRTNPGHGYPESTEYSFDIQIYSLKEDWEKEISRMQLAKREFKAIQGFPATISTNVSVSINLNNG